MIMTTLFNEDWLFSKGSPENWAPVEIPHDWLIYDTTDLYQTGVGWYKKEFDAGFLKQGQRLFVRFDGVYMDSALFVNDKKCGEWKYGYTAFEFDITDFLSAGGKNTLLLKVNYQSPNSRWYTGAGIYRDVFLKVKNAAHFVSDGIYITPKKLLDGRWGVEADAEVEAGGRAYEVRHSILGEGDGLLIASPKLWDVDTPHLYTLRSELWVDGELSDTEENRFGLREIAFDCDKGFSLNGRHLKLNGVCLHHDLGALGAAVHGDAIRRQLILLKDMGVNAIRISHNPAAAVFMEIATEMGFLIVSELLDMWERPKNAFDYARFFHDWVEKDAASWIRRDRNLPSVIMWSVGNEIYDTHADERGLETMRYLMELVKRHDPKGHAPATLCSNYMLWENTQKCADVIKLIGYNYAESLYKAHHEAHPDWLIYGSETASTVQSRGVYHFPLSKSILSDDDLQCSALGNSSTSWGARSVEACIIADRDTEFSMGQFIWSGFDYIGEPTPYHTKNSYLGHIDTAGFPKDSYYVFQAAWTDGKKAPMIHLFPYWDFSEGQMIDVRACTNAAEAELFLNGESLGRKALGDRYIADWRIPYKKGVLRAVAYDEQGNIVAEEVKKSFGDVNAIHVAPQTVGELIFAEIMALDKDGNPVENANCRVRVQVENGTLLGLDNGDAADYEQYKTDCRRLFSGKLLAIVRPDEGKTAVISAEMDTADIPVRKIELIADGFKIRARVLPENATYTDLYWRLTDSAGIDSPLGVLEVAPDGRSATITPKGDGEVFVRCSPKNGKEHFDFISQFPITITGMGKPFLDPYSFVSGGLCGKSNVELTNGNERGVATLRGCESHVGFADLDFGEYGSDEITLPLFPLESDPFPIEIWEGMPPEGEHICTVTYDKGSIWNTYQEVTYKLPRRLFGVTTLCLVFKQKVHIKGFTFTRLEKAFQKLYATENSMIYGDSFTLAERAVEGIGNNVSLVYENMDFGAGGTERIELCWRSQQDRNSVQFVFADENGGEIRKMLEIPRSGEYRSEVFSLGERILGKRTVSLIFLPGCNIDVSWFRFEGKEKEE